MKIKELLDSPEKWTKDAYAEDKDGQHVFGTDSGACRWCLSGAVDKCYGGPLHDIVMYGAIQDKLHYSVKQLYGVDGIIAFNDQLCTTFEDIRRVLEHADV